MDNVFSTFSKKHDYLICIDSDGCAMDTMDIKHINCFGPCMVKEWHLEQWQDEILTRWNAINLYTMTRGINRFKGLAIALKEIDAQYCPIEDLDSLLQWVDTSKELSNKAIKQIAEETRSIALQKAYQWSLAVNASIEKLPDECKQPFNGVKEGLKKAHLSADIAIVSSANPEAVIKEWNDHGLMDSVDIMLAQNVGSKAYCIGEMAKKGYDKAKILMVGDAPGDRDAASKNGVLYYPILVRKETQSWEKFTNEALDLFLNNAYAGEYQAAQIRAFEENLSNS
ncbi:MAG: HAD family hydrolase [Lachnospiraceae bacterium]